MFRFSPIFNDFSMDYRWLSLINLWLISWLIIGGLALDLRYLDRCTPQSPDPIGDHNRPFAIGSTFSLKTNTFSFQKNCLPASFGSYLCCLILPSFYPRFDRFVDIPHLLQTSWKSQWFAAILVLSQISGKVCYFRKKCTFVTAFLTYGPHFN